MSGSQVVPVGGSGNAADKEAEDARRFILQVKRTVERCVAQGMNKEQMFRAIREEGLHPGAAFAVYKELRRQNRGFFREYYCMIDLKEQRERLDRLILAYRTGGRSNAVQDGVHVPPETATTLSMLEWADQQSMQAWLSDSGHQLAPAEPWSVQAARLPTGEQLVPNHGEQPVANAVVAWPQQALHLTAWQQLLNHEQHTANRAFHEPAWPSQAFHLPVAQSLRNHVETVANGGFPGLVWPQQEVHLPAGQQLLHNHQQPVHLPTAQLHYHEQSAAMANGLPTLTSAAGLLNDAMMDPWHLPHGSLGSWQGQQPEPMKQWWRDDASANPSSSLSEPAENRNYKTNISFHEHLQ
ncbi:hypothetical protein EJB05_53141 [Eragrostis curvula]|uniref:Uncharacterized protein n=1 Tax=Eragrostis curvula TaxID=38414 RepID=A0A5J9SR34_9POAL|nr:hypothetical protein EJB05_53141 [Eragrostis curvula]